MEDSQFLVGLLRKCFLMNCYENSGMALHYSSTLKECIHHQVVSRYVLYSEHFRKFFHYLQLPKFDIAADAAAIFKHVLKLEQEEYSKDEIDWSYIEFVDNQNMLQD